ncbi:MAG TPA: hypothetical protein VFE18_13540 [Phenylobacterium sp.]|jgi:hypothetical protein|uniref:hypothetical protein n=1 Tax=Phenylobacterium sp. TaxID=1871053 RepID=UPI002D5161DD|nr:hypothetical protein [Phenylobacterium sp.]HZZ69190.1 hypothetical protein [Phenylobacterium sp.]
MRSVHIAVATAGVLALSLSACSQGRKAEADTGTAKAVVSTQAPPAAVPNSQLETQAVEAATAASTPVDGSGPVKNVTPSGSATPTPATTPPKK